MFGIDTEAPWVIAVGVAASVLLAGALWLSGKRRVLLVAIAFGLLLTALDLRETVHQINESRAALVAVSVVLTMMHLAVVGIAAALLQRRSEVGVPASR